MEESQRSAEGETARACSLVLRQYQAELVAKCGAAFTTSRTVCLQLGTGGGKTTTAAEIIRRAVAKGRRVVFAAHLDTLIADTSGRLARAGIHHGIVQADKPTDPTAPVQVCSLATLSRRGTRPPADLIIVDECHRALAATVRKVLSAYPDARILGLTATPCRADDQPLGDVFDALVLGPTVKWLTANGFLVPCDIINPAEPIDALLCEPIDAYRQYAPTGRAIAFCESVVHAEWVAAGFNAYGIAAEAITGETSATVRTGIRERLALGTTSVLVGVDVFTEGFDAPSVDTVIVARSCHAIGRWLQMIGRGLRAFLGKTHCTVIDLKGAVNLLCLPDEDLQWSLIGKPRRTEPLKALMRCAVCLAIYRPKARCPRCGEARQVDTKLPRVLAPHERRAIKEERLSRLTPEERDERHMHSLINVATHRLGLRGSGPREWAGREFFKRFGRRPLSTKGAA